MSETSFLRSARLLKPAEFKRVFDNTEWRSSSPQLLLLATANEQNQARLGFVLAKKQIKRAVDRNRVKRIIRESFRHHQQQLDALDFVVLGRSGLAELDNQQIRAMIDALWFRLKRPSNDRQANGRRSNRRPSGR
ncbi:ribonuclease P protein component [Venatoribacter cucullus]|uniref:Ribonuclease P protein component n=1 Tax=Venatoribacter cucullus TaxID=2661630 RepID=A0A9E8JQL0_9GAMM|nr:ribonuclease P protein component [Venatoribacter cucullus]QQD22820.1 ribonuclease P protein component [Oceanospirillaceae bacterium ASx5O]QQD25386.1 ribonuclease P protein component [Venatoribacter cucullus]UZK04797.1 ribonuclease P protein component [Venatoribacter cucullus]